MKRPIPIDFFYEIYGVPFLKMAVKYGGRNYRVTEINERTVILED